MLLACALLVDAALRTLWPPAARAAVVPLAVVAAISLAQGVRRGMVAGFTVGVLLDVLAGPSSVAGVHALTGLLLGVAVGWTHRDPRHGDTGFAVVVGGLAVAVAAVVFTALQRSLGYAPPDTMGSVVAHAVVVGSVATPIAQRGVRVSAGWPLSLTSPRT